MLVRFVEPTDASSDDLILSVMCASRGRTMLQGDLDVSGRAILGCASRRIVTNGRGVITLDLSAVTFIDAAGVTALTELAHFARAHRRELVVSRPSASVQRVLEVVAAFEALPFNIATPRRRMRPTRRLRHA